MSHFKLKSVLFLSFMNSAGVFTMWLLLGPYYSSALGGIAAFGFVGMVRQFSGIFGTVLSGTVADSGYVLRKHIAIEAIILFLILFFAVIFSLKEQTAVDIVPIWVFIRFFLASVSFVFFYKFLTLDGKNFGSSSITQLMVTQGATLIAPIIATFIPFYSNQSFFTAIIFDLLTSLIYILSLFTLISTPLDQKIVTPPRKTFLYETSRTLTIFFSKELFPWNIAQFLFLLSVSGYFVLVLKLSEIQNFLPKEVFFPAINIFYGLSIWINALFFKKIKSPEKSFIISIFFLIGSGLLLFSDQLWALIFSVMIMVSALWSALHSSNKMILDLGHESSVGRLRASMVFYLAAIFGFGEYLYGLVFDLGFGTEIMGIARVILCISILLFLRQILAQRK